MASLLPGDSGVEKCEVTGGEGEKIHLPRHPRVDGVASRLKEEKKNPPKIISKRNVI